MNKLALALVLSLAACGGSLKNTVNDNALGSTTTEERVPIQQARDEHSRAEDALRQARSEEQKADHDRQIADNDAKTAKLQRDSAKLNKKAAENGGDVNSQKKAGFDYAAAEKGKTAADAKSDWLDKKYKYAKQNREAAEDLEQATAAKVELEKAKLCQAKGIRPSEKFNVMDFDQQTMQKQMKYNDARKSADELKMKSDDLERRYLTAKQDADATKSMTQGM